MSLADIRKYRCGLEACTILLFVPCNTTSFLQCGCSYANTKVITSV